MSRGLRYALPMACALLFAAGPALAQQGHDQGQGQGHEQGHEQGHPPQGHEAHPAPAAHAQPPGEPHRGPTGYHRATAPKGWNTRPQKFDPKTYQHNYRAARSFKIGPYQRPAGWSEHRWVYGETLPRAYWAPAYVIADYWLFALNVPPVGYEWVRDDADALLINTSTGVILQVDYGVFA